MRNRGITAFFLVMFLTSFVSFRSHCFQVKNIDEEMMEAVKKGDISKVQELIEKGANLNFKGRSGPLHQTIRLNRLKIAELLIAKGADVNAQNQWDWTPIFFSKSTAAVELLISKGANPSHKAEDGLTPLHMEALSGRVKSADVLIKNGADVNARDNRGKTPLFSAIKKEIAEFLISKGAIVNTKDNYGMTPLHAAIMQENEPYEVSEILVAKGADINSKTTRAYDKFPEESTPLDFAEKERKPDIIELLESKGGKRHTIILEAKIKLRKAQEKVESDPTPENHFLLGLIHEENLQDYTSALKQYDQGKVYIEESPWLYYHVGFCHEKLGMYEKAVENYRRSISVEFNYRPKTKSFLRLGMLYEGEAIKKDDVEAAKMYRQAAEMNDPEAQFRLGLMYEEGRGVEKNFDEAVFWYRKSSNRGYKFAQQKMEELKEPPFPHDDSHCEEIDIDQIKVPEDFYIIHSSGPTHAEWGADRSIAVSADGRYTIKESSFSREEHKEITKVLSEGRISPEAVKRIYAKVLGCKFFELEKGYWNPDVHDGKRDLMRVVAHEKAHSVVTYYYQVIRFDSIQIALAVEVSDSSRND